MAYSYFCVVHLKHVCIFVLLYMLFSLVNVLKKHFFSINNFNVNLQFSVMTSVGFLDMGLSVRMCTNMKETRHIHSANTKVITLT